MDNDNQRAMIFYQSWTDCTELMTDSEELEYYRAIISYGFDGEVPDGLSSGVRMAMRFVTSAIDRNKEKRERIIERRREAGRKGNEKRWGTKEESQDIANVANAIDASQNIANDGKSRYNVNVNDNVNVITNKCVIDKKRETIEKKKKSPSLDEVLSVCEELGIDSKIGKKYFKLYDPEWLDSDGCEIGNWKLHFKSFAENEHPKKNKTRRVTTTEPKYEEVKIDTSKTGGKAGLEAYKAELRAAKEGDERMREKYKNWEMLCKQKGI